jgi:hypothetical protein
MNKTKPEYLRPALLAGAVAGLLSGLPIIGAGNCLCCLWIVGGAAVAAKLLAAQTPGLLTAGDGAIVGALTGIVAAVVDTLVKLPLQRYNLELARRILDRFSELGTDIPSSVEGWFDLSSGAISPAWLLFGLFVSAAVYAVMGALGGTIGVSLFGRKTSPPAPSAPAAPPAAPQGPSDAA